MPLGNYIRVERVPLSNYERGFSHMSLLIMCLAFVGVFFLLVYQPELDFESERSDGD